MKFQLVRIKDIAKEVGFSPSTVSRALRDSHEISDDTKKIVLACAEKLHYRPNPLARGLRSKQTHAIAIIVSEISNAFFSEVISGIESVAFQHGYNLIILQNNEQSERKLETLDYLTASIDGLLISVSSEKENTGLIMNLHKYGLPIVFFDRVIDEIVTHKVVLDNTMAGYIATRHLVRLGCRRIAAFVNAPHITKCKDRVSGFKKAMDEAFLQHQPDWIKYCNVSPGMQAEVDRLVSDLLNLPEPPDGFVVLDDHLTKAVIKALKKKDKRAADTPKIVGFSNSDFYELITPPLSIVRQPAGEMGRLAMTLLLQLLKSKRPVTDFTTEILEPEIIVQNSK